MFAEFKTLWELQEEGSLEQMSNSIQGSINNFFKHINMFKIDLNAINEQAVIAIIGVIIIGIIFLPFGSTETSIKSCQIDTNKKVIKLGGALIVVMTSISAILFIEILELSESLGILY